MKNICDSILYMSSLLFLIAFIEIYIIYIVCLYVRSKHSSHDKLNKLALVYSTVMNKEQNCGIFEGYIQSSNRAQ